jgi:predicted ester cyclase
MPTPESLLRAWFDGVWGQADETAIDRLLHADGLIHGLPTPDGTPLRGPEQFKPFYRAFRAAFPDIAIELRHVVAQGDLAVAHCLVRATHTGDGLGVPPTGRTVTFEGFAMCRAAGDRVAEAFNCFDFLGMYRQLGADLAFAGAGKASAAGQG